MKVKTLSILTLLIFSIIGISRISAQTITIDLSKEYQTIRGFGGMNHTTWINDLNEDNREKAFGNDPGEIGLSILRIHLDPNPQRFNLEIPTAIYAIQKGAKAFATPWNAPTALLDPTSNPGRVDPNKYGEYVAHLNAFNAVMSNNGVPLYAVSVQNEPDWGEWTRWTSTEMLDFMRNYAQNIDNRVMAPESFQFRRSFTDPILNDSLANAHLDIVGGHIYGGGLMDYPLARAKGKEVWMTEHLLGSGDGHINNWDLAVTVAKEINDCMKANFNAYVWWYIRRSYGLITDDGNITDKGYIMSQFTKFIRPGAVRVDASLDLAINVDVTAYKTDTSFAMVVINRKKESVEMNFNIENGNVERLNKFTTSEIKKMVNDGEMLISGGTFSTTLDANSVTTFTSDPENGGKQDNNKPTAFAGDDLIVEDTVGTGSVVVKLDGLLSNDNDGEITNYSWSLNGEQLAWESTHDVTISIGEYNFVLTVTDDDGATATDTLHIELNSTRNTEIWLEAECGTVGASWQSLANANASNGTYVETNSGIQSLSGASTNPDNLITYSFTTSETGNYKVWGRVITPTADDDSFWIKIDDLDWTMWNSIPSGSAWHWDDVHSYSNENVVLYELEPGSHTLSICLREDGAKLDKILISNTGITPNGYGNDAGNCQSTSNINLLGNSEGIFDVYPNPTTGQVTIFWDKKFKSLKVFNLQGQIQFYKEYTSEIEVTDEMFDLDPGIYFIILQNDISSVVKKLIIK
ncbi:MAG: T9SS type A sorting domain-containing protein [Mariniphaga sp.]|nr:T9SS type A sorting domain-containing protein [Mariniphaga sp.]